jgi:uncharacterized metal-binding protein YceD (DUF177 family)
MSELDWSHRVAEIRTAQTFRREADADECGRMSALIGNAKCLSIAAEYSIKPDDSDRYEVRGHVRARLEQTCGVTLEPMWQEIDEPIEVVFEAGIRGADAAEMAIDPLGEDPPEPIYSGRLEVGRIVAEIIVSAADPFPRSAEAELDHSQAGGDDTTSDGAENPFTVLRQLAAKTDQNDD